MKKIIIIVVLFIIFTICCTICIYHYFIPKYVFSDLNLFKSGDILLLRGTTLRSLIVYVMTKDKDEFSHAGVINITNNIPFFVHATPKKNAENKGDKVITETLDAFMRNNTILDVAILRLKFESSEIASTAAKNAANYAKQSIPFDHEFNLKSDDKLYCTELIWYAYKCAGLDLIEGQFDKMDNPMVKGDAILPSTFKKSRYLDEIVQSGTSKKTDKNY